MKWREEKNLTILGFVDKEKISREAYMSEVEMVIPKKGVECMAGRKLFTALVMAMKSMGRYALARYIPRNSKTGVLPKLAVLIPFLSK